MRNIDSPPLDRYDFTRVQNMWLPLILDVVADLIERWELCDCQDCVLDTVALAMNSLPPKYWVLGGFDAFSSTGDFLEDSMNKRLAEEAVLRALKMVQANPHH